MADAVLTWQKSPSANVEAYSVIWTRNGAALPAFLVPQSSSGDASGYSTDFNTGNPTITLAPGDVVGATVTAMDTVNNLSSSPAASTPPTVTVPGTPPTAPDPPQNVALALA